MSDDNKTIDDLRPTVWRSNYHTPNQVDTNKLATKYGFYSEFPLQDRLETVYMFEEAAGHIQTDRPRNVMTGDRLKAIKDHCEILQELLEKSDGTVRSLLGNASNNTDKINIERIRHDLKLLGIAALIASVEMEPKTDPTKVKNEAIRYFVWNLADIWEEGTGKSPTTYSVADKGYSGNFFKFALECATLGKIPLRNSSGGTVSDILKERKEKRKIR